MTDHPLTEITDEMCDAAVVPLLGRALNDRKAMRAALSAALAATTPSEPLARTLLAVPDTHGAPHHDADRIKAVDYVVQVDDDGDIRHGLAHHQDEDGDWMTEDSGLVTWASRRADRPDAVTVWPTPTPPAEEVELPTEFGAVVRYVEDNNGSTYSRMVFDGTCYCRNDTARLPQDVRAFTLPDGTRARRDGERGDGTPRFVKVQEDDA